MLLSRRGEWARKCLGIGSLPILLSAKKVLVGVESVEVGCMFLFLFKALFIYLFFNEVASREVEG